MQFTVHRHYAGVYLTNKTIMTFYDVYDIYHLMTFVAYDIFRIMTFVGYDVCNIMKFVTLLHDVCRL